MSQKISNKKLLDKYKDNNDPYYSASRLNRYIKCPSSYYLHYRLYKDDINYVSIPNEYMIQGKIIHSAMEHINKQKKFIYNDCLDFGIGVIKEENKLLVEKKFLDNSIIDKAIKLARPILFNLSSNHIQIAIQSDLVEHELVLERIKKGQKPYLLLAYLDSIIYNEDRVTIIDWKTDSFIDPKKHQFQALLYSVMYEKLFNKKVDFLIGYVKERKTFKMNLGDYKTVLKTIDSIVSNIRKQIWIPNVENCNIPYKCDFIKDCPFINKTYNNPIFEGLVHMQKKEKEKNETIKHRNSTGNKNDKKRPEIITKSNSNRSKKKG